MPITKSAKKALRQSSRKKTLNDRRTRTMKDGMKKFLKLAMSEKKEAQILLPTIYASIDKAAKIGVIKKNTASRKKSRIARALNK